MTKPAGWYRDSETTGALRYWDGERWADQRAAEPPRPKKSRLDWMVLGGLGLAIVVIIGGVTAAVTLAMRMDVGEQAPTAQATNADAPTPTTLPAASAPSVVEPTAIQDTAVEETQAAGPGQEVRDGHFSFVVGDVERVYAVAHPDQPESQKEPQGEFVIVHVTVTNIGADRQPFYVSFSTLSDGSTVYESDAEAWLYLGNTLTVLAPGASLQTVLVFDVPEGTEVQSIELHESPSSHGATVGL